MRVIYCILLAAFCSIAQAQDHPEQAAIDEINRLGRMIYEYDQAAWHATDAVLPLLQAAGDSITQSVHGYVVEKRNDEWHVIWGRLSEDSSTYIVAYEVWLDSDYKVISSEASKGEDVRTGFPVISGRALVLARQEYRSPPNMNFNLVILPEQSGGAYIYLLPAQPALNIYYLGADLRFRYDPQEDAIVETTKMHNTIQPFNLRENPSRTTISTAVLTSIPTETDVFYAISRPSGEVMNASHVVLTDSWAYLLNSNGVFETMTRKDWDAKMDGQ